MNADTIRKISGITDRSVTVAQIIGATGAHTENALAETFEEGFGAAERGERNHGGGYTDADLVRAWTAGWESAIA